MVIRAAVKDDIFNISRLYALSWKKAYVGIVPQGYLDRLRDDAWTIKFEDDMENGWLKYNVAVENGCIVGCIAFGESRAPDRKREHPEIMKYSRSMYILIISETV